MKGAELKTNNTDSVAVKLLTLFFQPRFLFLNKEKGEKNNNSHQNFLLQSNCKKLQKIETKTKIEDLDLRMRKVNDLDHLIDYLLKELTNKIVS